ncbi:MAG: hypothetical protein ACK4UO_16670 [Pseudolabrys sp.]
MKQRAARAVARRTELSSHEFVGLCGTAMWGLALAYLLVTFQVY